MKSFFTNNPLWHDKIGKIYALLERVRISEEQLKDRRTNRILSVGSTTTIEGNRLTVQQVFDVIEDAMYQYTDIEKSENSGINGGLNSG